MSDTESRPGRKRPPRAAAASRRPAAKVPQPRIRLTPDRISVAAGQPVTVTVNVTNATSVIDAFRITVLGVDGHRITARPEMVSLFPDANEDVEVVIELPPDFPVGDSELWIKATSCTDEALFAMAALGVKVPPTVSGEMTIDPNAATGRRTGRYGVTLRNLGNTPMDLMLIGSDDENHFAYRFDRERLRLEPGETTSVQVVVSGRRAFTGSAVPRAFTITAESSGHVMTTGAALAQRPYVPRLALMLVAVVAMFALWAVVVGASIDKVIDDSDNDLAESFQDGMGDVVDGIEADRASASALGDAQAAALAARSQDGTSGAGVDVSAGTGADAGGGASGDASGGSTDGATDGSTDGAGGGGGGGDDAGPAVADPATDLPLIAVPPDSLAGYVVAAADLTSPATATGAARPIPGASVTLEALIETPPLAGTPDPNRAPVVLAADDAGVFRVDGLIPGTYRATFSAAGYVDVVCASVTVPTTPSPLGSCTAGAQPVIPGPASVVTLPGAISSIAGLVTADGAPLAGVQVAVTRLDRTTGTPTQAAPTFVTEPNGRFAFVFDPDEAALTPGTFELQFVLDGYLSDRVVVELSAGQRIVGLEAVLTLVPTTTTSTLPPEQRSVSGTVTNAIGGGPIANASVTITGSGGTYVVATLSNGSYRIEGLATGLYNLAFSAAGFQPAARSITVPTDDRTAGNASLVPIPVPETTTTTTTVLPVIPVTTTTLPADQRSVSGRVTAFNTNLPIEAAQVTLTGPGGTFTAFTGVDGTYQLLDLPVGLYKATFSSRPDFFDGVKFVRVPSTDPNNGDMVLRIAD